MARKAKAKLLDHRGELIDYEGTPSKQTPPIREAKAKAADTDEADTSGVFWKGAERGLQLVDERGKMLTLIQIFPGQYSKAIAATMKEAFKRYGRTKSA